MLNPSPERKREGGRERGREGERVSEGERGEGRKEGVREGERGEGGKERERGRGRVQKHKCIHTHIYNESTKVQNPRRNSYAGLTFNSSWLRTHIHYTSVVYCACTCECLAAPSRPSPVSRLFHAGCTSS